MLTSDEKHHKQKQERKVLMSGVIKFERDGIAEEEKLKQAALRKKKKVERRKELLVDFSSLDRFRDLHKSDHLEVFGLLRKERWRLHAAALKHNLAVSRRRTVNTPNETMKFAGSNPSHLTLFRLIVCMWAEGDLIETNELYVRAQDWNYGKSTVNNFLADCLSEKILVRIRKGVFEISEDVIEDHWENLLCLIFNKTTYEFVTQMNRVYSMLKFASERKNSEFRKAPDTFAEKTYNVLASEDNS